MKVYVDQETLLIDSVSWEASLQAAITRHDWTEASSLLESIPDSVLREGELQVRLDCPDSPNSFFSVSDDEAKVEETRFQGGLDGLDVDAVEVVIPKVKFLVVSLGNVCTGWMYQMTEEKLVKSGIFLRSYWNGTRQLISLLARAGLLSSCKSEYHGAGVEKKVKLHKETEQAIHELVLRHCVRFSLPNLMTVYLDHHSLALDAMSSIVMQAVMVLITNDIFPFSRAPCITLLIKSIRILSREIANGLCGCSYLGSRGGSMMRPLPMPVQFLLTISGQASYLHLTLMSLSQLLMIWPWLGER